MTSTRSVIFATPIRTAIGTFGGSLKDIPAPDLGAIAVRAAVERAGVKPEEIGTTVLGNVVQAGTKMNPARQATIHAGLPVSVPAMTVNRVCGSGAQAIVSAAQIVLGNIDVAVAGGVENIDLAPYLVPRARWGYRMGDGQLYDSVLRDGLNDAFSDAHAGWHTEDWLRNSRFLATPRTAGPGDRSSGSARPKPMANSFPRLSRFRCLPGRRRPYLKGMSTTRPARRSKRWPP